jgi:ribosomal protein L32E
MARKATWLYGVAIHFDELIWGKGEQRLHPKALEKYGYKKARRIGMMAMVGGKDKTKIRNATPPGFRDVLVSLCR